MKIGIITLHNVINYGAVFQAYALNEYLTQNFGEDSTINVINYMPDFFESKKKLNFSTDLRANLIEAERLLLWSKINRRDTSFNEFITRNDSLTSLCKTKDEVADQINEYDAIIAGSDQIWNFHITGGDKTYLLDFPEYKGKLLSYASSLGSYRFYKSAEDDIKNIFSRFSSVSCREKDGCEYISELTGRECTQVCDPTLLVHNSVYSKLFEGRVRNKIEKLANENFLLIYNLSNSEEIYNTAKKVADERGLKVYQIFPSMRKNAIVDKLLNDISPEEFLYLYSKADFIVTNSFHGTCFSLIYRKNFFTVNPTGSNNRLTSMLEKLNLSDRFFTKLKELETKNCSENIDYESRECLFDKFTEKSIEYLNNALNKE